MAAIPLLEGSDDVASKVLRRAKVSKITRTLQDRLALANVKIQNGWQNMSLDTLEPHVEEHLRRKRPASSNDTFSDTASTTSSRLQSSNGLASSPLTEPLFSDDYSRSGGSQHNKRIKPLRLSKQHTTLGISPTGRTRAPATRQTWKSKHRLPQSSPIKGTKHAHFPSTHISTLSFISEGSTIPDDPPSPEFSEEDDADLPLTSFAINASTHAASSPPHTPPPDRRLRKTQTQNVSWSRTPKTREEGVDLLMYLAASPQQTNADDDNNAKAMVIQPPSTPPCKSTPLPSSHMTPGTSGNGFMTFGLNTPGMGFNFADFVTMSPSPAQGPWNRTPVAGRTPGASARRKLNFDALAPSTSSPVVPRSSGRTDGLGMELGGELAS